MQGPPLAFRCIEDNSYVRISVENGGETIPETHQRLFDRFIRSTVHELKRNYTRLTACR
jgi:signal transduction histidine kinase